MHGPIQQLSDYVPSLYQMIQPTLGMWGIDCNDSPILWQLRLSMSPFNLFGSHCNYFREFSLLDALILIFSKSKFASPMIFISCLLTLRITWAQVSSIPTHGFSNYTPKLFKV